MICGGGLRRFDKSKLNRSLKISATYEMMSFWEVCPQKLLQTSINTSRPNLKLAGYVQGLIRPYIRRLMIFSYSCSSRAGSNIM